MIKLLFADCDLTLITFDAEAGYRAAAESLSPTVGLDSTTEIFEALLQQYRDIHDNVGMVRTDVTTAFAEYVRRTPIPEEVMWSRFAAFMHHLTCKPYRQHGSVYFRHVAAEAERVFWRVITQTSGPYNDVATLIGAARHNNGVIQPVTSSDVRMTMMSYFPKDSTELKQHHLRAALGRFMPTPIVFEEYAKRSEVGWRKYVQPHYTPEQIRDAAIVGDSLSDVEAGVTTGMRVRILIDRDNRYTTCPAPATHLVRSLDEVPAILGWLT